MMTTKAIKAATAANNTELVAVLTAVCIDDLTIELLDAAAEQAADQMNNARSSVMEQTWGEVLDLIDDAICCQENVA